MKFTRMMFAVALIVAAGGCLSMRRAWESGNPLYVGQWRYAAKVYSGVDRDTFKQVLLKGSDIGLNPWPLEKSTADRIESQWVTSGDERRRLEMRIDESKDEKGRPGYLVSLRMLVQKTREPYTVWRTNYHWRSSGQDSEMEGLILAKIRDEMRQYEKNE